MQGQTNPNCASFELQKGPCGQGDPMHTEVVRSTHPKSVNFELPKGPCGHADLKHTICKVNEIPQIQLSRSKNAPAGTKTRSIVDSEASGPHFSEHPPSNEDMVLEPWIDEI